MAFQVNDKVKIKIGAFKDRTGVIVKEYEQKALSGIHRNDVLVDGLGRVVEFYADTELTLIARGGVSYE